MAKAEQLIKSIADKIDDLTTLKIQTLMGTLVTNDDGTTVTFKPNEEVKGMISRIDLIEGDIKTELSEEFYVKYPELVQFHQSREARGSEIIEKNIQTLKTIIDVLFDLKDKIG